MQNQLDEEDTSKRKRADEPTAEGEPTAEDYYEVAEAMSPRKRASSRSDLEACPCEIRSLSDDKMADEQLMNEIAKRMTINEKLYLKKRAKATKTEVKLFDDNNDKKVQARPSFSTAKTKHEKRMDNGEKCHIMEIFANSVTFVKRHIDLISGENRDLDEIIMKRVKYHKQRIDDCLDSRKDDRIMDNYKNSIDKMIRGKEQKLRSIVKFNYTGEKGYPRSVFGLEITDLPSLCQTINLLSDEIQRSGVDMVPERSNVYAPFVARHKDIAGEIVVFDSLYPNKGPGNEYERKIRNLRDLRFYCNLDYIDNPNNLEYFEAHGVDFFAICELKGEERQDLLRWFDENVPETRKVNVKDISKTRNVWRIYYFGIKHEASLTSYNRAYFSGTGDISFLEDDPWDLAYSRLSRGRNTLLKEFLKL